MTSLHFFEINNNRQILRKHYFLPKLIYSGGDKGKLFEYKLILRNCTDTKLTMEQISYIYI